MNKQLSKLQLAILFPVITAIILILSASLYLIVSNNKNQTSQNNNQLQPVAGNNQELTITPENKTTSTKTDSTISEPAPTPKPAEKYTSQVKSPAPDRAVYLNLDLNAKSKMQEAAEKWVNEVANLQEKAALPANEIPIIHQITPLPE